MDGMERERDREGGRETIAFRPQRLSRGETKSLQRNMAARSGCAMIEESTNSGIAGMEYVLRLCEALAGRVTALEEVRHLRP